MDAGLIERIESGTSRAAAALFAAAVGFACYKWFDGQFGQPQLAACTAGGAALAYLPCSHALASAGRRGSRFNLPDFEVRDIETVELADELLLTSADRLHPLDELLLTDADRFDPSQPLVLEDVLTAIDSEARVVRLFDRTAMPTPGELQSRIANHLGQTPVEETPPDASQALSAALAELRRSLR
jgi:hypothetical protein